MGDVSMGISLFGFDLITRTTPAIIKAAAG
jgi:hypothetical protein